ncbi:protein CcmA, bactofilin family [Evansella caseinilytica]|uniref:Protein CcmA, bactofilin family n=1 Tax=Evansella caseinilytica TaxID=1503961 RepID=A0A1H3ULI7_9BACI|nr:polymer-forming cytoskeletal protein [Evansella caseinilytica]SDZ63228.1 protein CcmA, bactofilin family [Evansella caseinilytica]
MFSKQKTEKKLSEISTIIGQETKVDGVLNVESSIRIDGKVYGEIKCTGDVTIGKEGYVEKTLTARNLYIAGTIKGNVKVENKIHIYETGSFSGTAEMKTIIIDENGHFHGQSLMKGSSEEAAKVVEIEQDKPSATKK